MRPAGSRGGRCHNTHVCDPFLSVELIYGDDSRAPRLKPCFEEEKEGYASLGAEEHSSANTYGYHGLNLRHGFPASA